MPIVATRSSSTSRSPAPDPDRRPAGPEDHCPYPRPFDWHFTDCDAFMPRLHLATDTHGNQLSAHWTCAHLLSRQRETGGFYGACALGGAGDRLRWARAMKEGQLAAIRLARVELSQFIRPELEQIRKLVSGRLGGGDRPRREEIQAGWARLVAVFNQFVAAQPGLFEAAGINSEALQRCFGEAMAEFASRQWGHEWRMAESVVSRYPWPIVAFFRPDLVRDGAVVTPESG